MDESLRSDPDRLLQLVLGGTAGDIGEDFFRSLVRHVGEALGVRYAFVAVFPGAPERLRKDRVQTLAWWSRDGYMDNVEYAVAGSPCELVLAGEMRLFRDNVVELFPAEEKELRALGAVSYLAMPLFDTHGEVMGHLAVIVDKPMHERPSLWAPEGISARRPSGEPFAVDLTVSPAEVAGGGDRSMLFTLILRDTAARAAADRELKRLRLTASYLRGEAEQQFDLGGVVTRAPNMQKVIDNARRVAATDSTVLLNGETGVGKELMARAIHGFSSRADKPLIKINCAALPAELIESELFGHEAGAFTGAVGKRVGRFELADGGTLFLDEVGELTAAAQAKLLRALQEREFERVGGTRSIRVDVRVIAATNRDLGAMVASGGFRGDLYYRLNVFPLRIPPLRERREDIPVLAGHFLARYGRDQGRTFAALCPETLDKLQTYPWPGNVRELQNVLERAAILSDGPTVLITDTLISPVPIPPMTDAAPDTPAADSTAPADAAMQPRRLDEAERRHIQLILDETGWTIEGPGGAAAVLGIAPSTLRSRMKKLGIRRG